MHVSWSQGRVFNIFKNNLDEGVREDKGKKENYVEGEFDISSSSQCRLSMSPYKYGLQPE